MPKYFITVEYRNYLAPNESNGPAWRNWRNNTGLQTCNGFIDQHPVHWIEKQYQRQRESWEAEKDHTRFETVLFYTPLEEGVNTDYLQDLS